MKRCLDAIEELSANGVAPTYQDLADHLGYPNKSRPWYLVNALVKRGLVVRGDHYHRGLALAKVRDAESLPLDDMAGAVVRLQGLSSGCLTFDGVRRALAQAYARGAQ